MFCWVLRCELYPGLAWGCSSVSECGADVRIVFMGGTHVAVLAGTSTGLAALLQAHSLHTLLHALLATTAATDLELAERDATVLIVGRHFLPLFHLGDTCPADGFLGVRDRSIRGHITNLNKRHRNQTRTAQTADGLGNKPLGVGLGNDNDRLACLCLEFVCAFGLEVVHDDTVDHGAVFAESGFAVAGLARCRGHTGCRCHAGSGRRSGHRGRAAGAGGARC